MMTSQDAFFIFSKFWFSGLLEEGGGGGGGVKGPKKAQNDKKFLSHSVSQELYLICLWFLIHMCKMISPAMFFSFLHNSNFLGFSKFINKCQNEILRCAPPSHVCDF